MNFRFIVLAAALTGCATSEDYASDTQMLASEQAPLPQTFTLDIDQLVGGETTRFVVMGAPANANINLVRAVGGGIGAGPCPAALGGQCLDINGPSGVAVFPFTITTNASGNGFRDVVVPSTVPDGVPVGFQAVHIGSLTGSVPLAVTSGPPAVTCVGDAYEPNDDGFTEATALVGTRAASVCGGSDFDWYMFTATAGQTIVVDALFDHISGTVDLDTYLYFGSPTDNTTFRSGLTYLVDGYSATDNEQMVYTATQTGTYYVLIHNFISASTTEAPYTLSATVTP